MIGTTVEAELNNRNRRRSGLKGVAVTYRGQSYRIRQSYWGPDGLLLIICPAATWRHSVGAGATYHPPRGQLTVTAEDCLLASEWPRTKGLMYVLRSLFYPSGTRRYFA